MSASRKWVFVVTLVVEGVFRAAFAGKTSVLFTSSPNLQTSLVFTHMASLIVEPSGRRLLAIPALDSHSCSVDVALGLVAPYETISTDGATKTTVVLLKGHSSCTRCFN
jgi:hypothetical protein